MPKLARATFTEEEAEECLKKVEKATHHFPSDACNAGMVYYTRDNIEEAIKWFEIAASQDIKIKQDDKPLVVHLKANAIDSINRAREMLVSIYGKDQKHLDREIYWFEKLIEQGKEYHLQVATLYYGKKNFDKAYEYFTIAESQPEHSSKAKFRLGCMHESGHNPEKTPNLYKAREYYLASSEMGNEGATLALARPHFCGDDDAFIGCIELASTQGSNNAKALSMIAKAFSSENEEDLNLAIAYLESIIAKGNKVFLMGLAHLYYKNNNFEKAKELCTEACTEAVKGGFCADAAKELLGELNRILEASFIEQKYRYRDAISRPAAAGAGSFSLGTSFVDRWLASLAPDGYVKRVEKQQITLLLSKVTGLDFTAFLKDTESYRVDALIEAKQVAYQAKLEALGISYERKNLGEKDYFIIEGVNMFATALRIQDACNSSKGQEVRCR